MSVVLTVRPSLSTATVYHRGMIRDIEPKTFNLTIPECYEPKPLTIGDIMEGLQRDKMRRDQCSSCGEMRFRHPSGEGQGDVCSVFTC